MVTLIERIKAEKIVKEFNDPLSKPVTKRPKRLKVYENFSQIEKNLFNEAKQIIKTIPEPNIAPKTINKTLIVKPVPVSKPPRQP